MISSILATADVSVVTELIKFISDNGIMIVICAVVIYFLIRVLNSMLEQNSQVVTQILPKISEIQSSLTDMLIKYNESETRRTLSVNKHFSDVQSGENDLLAKLKNVNKELVAIHAELEELSSEIEKQHVYMDFYQEQLKKEKEKEKEP